MSPVAIGTRGMSMPLNILLLGIGVVIVLVCSLLFGPLVYPFSPDSSVYIEVVRNFLAGHGLVLTPAPGQYDLEYEPLRLFPPGYPLLIALVAAFGLSPADVALWLSRLGWALLPWAAFFCLRPAMAAKWAMVIAVMAALSPGLLGNGYKALSDAPFLVMILVSFGLLLRSVNEHWSAGPILLAGLVTGLAYTVRNAGLAVIIAVTATFLLAVILKLLPLREAFLRLMVWTTGVALVVIPQWIWSFIAFGKLQAYTMPPSEIGLLENARTFFQMLLVDLSGSSTLGLLAWDAKLFILAGLGFSAVAYFGLRAGWREWGTAEKFSIMLFVLYLTTGGAMVIVARSIYQWGEVINLRHVMQYSWLVMAICVMLTANRAERLDHKMVAIVVIVVGLLFVGRVNYWVGEWRREALIQQALRSEAYPERAMAKLPDVSWVMTNQLKLSLFRDEKLARQVRRLPYDAYIISNYADVLKITTERAVRGLDSVVPAEARRLLENVLDHFGKNRPVYVLLFPNNRMLKEAPKQDWARNYLDPLPQGFSIVCRTPGMLLLARDFGHPGDPCRRWGSGATLKSAVPS